MAGEKSERAPAQTLDQRLGALRQANEIRSRRAALKKELASGRVRIADGLAQPPRDAKTATGQDVLLAGPKQGPGGRGVVVQAIEARCTGWLRCEFAGFTVSRFMPASRCWRDCRRRS